MDALCCQPCITCKGGSQLHVLLVAYLGVEGSKSRHQHAPITAQSLISCCSGSCTLAEHHCPIICLHFNTRQGSSLVDLRTLQDGCIPHLQALVSKGLMSTHRA